MEDRQEIWESVHDAAISAVCELDALCEKYDVQYLDYSKVYEKIMGICEEVK